MYGGKHTLYDVLEIPRDATDRDIHRAYRKAMAELHDDRTVPDARRQVLVRDAFEVLSDPSRRAAYDQSLRAPTLLGISGGEAPRKRWTVIIGSVFAALGLAYYFIVAREPDVSASLYPDTDGAMQVHTKASVAIGRVSRIDISGKKTPAGVAVAVEEGVMMTPCSGLGPGAHLVVSIPPRDVPGQLQSADEAVGLCKLRMQDAGSWPLTLTAQEPRPGERIYAVLINAQGEVVLREAKVERLSSTPAGRVVEVAKHLASAPDGSPLIDLHGRVFAVAMAGQHRMLPASWVEKTQPDVTPRKPAPRAREEGEDEGDPKPPPGGRKPLRPQDIPQERRDRIEKAFRPPPKVPDDL